MEEEDKIVSSGWGSEISIIERYCSISASYEPKNNLNPKL
jgi:hypothetical protein